MHLCIAMSRLSTSKEPVTEILSRRTESLVDNTYNTIFGGRSLNQVSLYSFTPIMTDPCANRARQHTYNKG